MSDHFDLLARVYERLIPPPDPAQLATLLGLPIRGSLLDAGGGTGRVAALLQPLVGRLVLSDQSPGMLREARRKPCVRPVRAHAERLPFPDASFERVLVVDALHHFRDQGDAITELVRVLRPGGRLVIEEPDYRRVPVKLVAFAERLALMRSRFQEPETISAVLVGHGLTTAITRDDSFRAWVVADR